MAVYFTDHESKFYLLLSFDVGSVLHGGVSFITYTTSPFSSNQIRSGCTQCLEGK